MERHWRTPWESLSINHNIIRTVIWRNSRLSEIGDYAFKDLNSIQRLDLSFNRLSQLNATSLSNLEVDLIDLDLSHNLFQQIPVDLFEQNKRVQSLETLRLNENPILIIPRRPFETLKTSLRVLELNYCQIRAIELNAFEGMRQLESVSLIGNHLRHLQQSTFADLNLRSFYVHENPLVCDCHMRWLIDYLKIVDYQQQTYESQLAILSTTKRFSLIGNNGTPRL
jgi:Leucine-rich repeat (LRR) protein